MKKIISLLLTVVLVFTYLSVFSISTFAENENDDDKYKELYDQKIQFLNEFYDTKETDRFAGGRYLCSEFLFDEVAWAQDKSQHEGAVLLYTEYAKDFSYYLLLDCAISIFWDTMFNVRDYRSVGYIDIDYSNIENSYQSHSVLRRAVKNYNISKSELLAAFEKMENDPEAIREAFPYFNDKTFELAKSESDGTYGFTNYPDFYIEAMYVEDEAVAMDLLCAPYCVYVPEMDRILFDSNMFFRNDDLFLLTDEEFAELLNCDLTTKGFDMFFEFIEGHIENGTGHYLDYPGDIETYQKLTEARNRQLNAKTGEDYSAYTIAAISLTLGVLAIGTKKKRT